MKVILGMNNNYKLVQKVFCNLKVAALDQIKKKRK